MPQFTEQQFMIGRLAWIEVHRGDIRLQFARLDLSVIPQNSIPEIEGVMADNGIVPSRLPGNPGFLQVALADQSGKNLDALRLASTNWAPSNNEPNKLFAVGNEMHDAKFLENAHKVTPQMVLESLKNLHARYGVGTAIQNGLDGKPYLVTSAQQSAKLDKVRDIPLRRDNLPYDYRVEEVKAGMAEASKPTLKARAVAGAALGVVASIPAAVETYDIAQKEIEAGKLPVGAVNYASRMAAETTAGGIAGAGMAVTAMPLLEIPPPAGEIAYGAAVLGVGYLGAEGTKKLMESADYYLSRAKSYFGDTDIQTRFEGLIKENASKAGVDPNVAIIHVYREMDKQATDHSPELEM